MIGSSNSYYTYTKLQLVLVQSEKIGCDIEIDLIYSVRVPLELFELRYGTLKPRDRATQKEQTVFVDDIKVSSNSSIIQSHSRLPI